jgi:hypothetical protein
MSSGGPLLGEGGFFGGGGGGALGPGGPHGAWPACGCSGLLMVIAGIILVCAGGMRMFNF